MSRSKSNEKTTADTKTTAESGPKDEKLAGAGMEPGKCESEPVNPVPIEPRPGPYEPGELDAVPYGSGNPLPVPELVADHRLAQPDYPLDIHCTARDPDGIVPKTYLLEFFTAIAGAATIGGRLEINFQSGPLVAHGVNGVTNEALIAIVLDRLRHMQLTCYSTIENSRAIEALELALAHLHMRTLDRRMRGVEGLYKK